jgi:hypothetical protein
VAIADVHGDVAVMRAGHASHGGASFDRWRRRLLRAAGMGGVRIARRAVHRATRGAIEIRADVLRVRRAHHATHAATQAPPGGTRDS